MIQRFKIKFARFNNWLCRTVLNECGYCSGALFWTRHGQSVCQCCGRRSG